MATQTQEQIVRLAPFQEQFLADIFKSAENLTGAGTQMPFSAQQLAELSEGQKQAISSALTGVGAFQPFLQQGRAAVTQGIAGVQGADFTPTSYQDFMSPFTEEVIDTTLADIAEQGAKQQAQLGAASVNQGAFGGSRQGIAQGEIAANVADQQARTAGQLRSQGFAQAQNLAQQAARQQLAQAQLGGQLGVSQAGLGQLGQQMGVQDINTLLGIGGLQQQQAQRQFDVTRANELARQALPFQRIGFMSDIFRGVPALQQTYSTTTTPPPSRTSQLLGLGIAGLGAAGQAKGFGNLFNFGAA
tara:strand:- start:6 stop:911 length:906 start_codon:yes stop_codon:yes gene_type:complete